MSDVKKPLGITDVVLRDAHQSLFATRMRLDDMLPIAEKLDKIGYWSLESWGGATFDSCIRYLGEDPGHAFASSRPPCPTRASRCCCAVRTCWDTAIMLMT